MKSSLLRSCALVGLCALCACGADDVVVSADSTPSRSVSQGGAQDVGEFRRVIADGDVPALSLLDDRGFFAEHAFELPAPKCDATVCAQPMLAVAPRFDMDDWTMAFVGLNTALDPTMLPRRPLHLVMVLEGPDAIGDAFGDLRAAVRAAGRTLGSGDVVSVIGAGVSPQRLLEAVPASRLDAALSALPEAGQGADSYGGLASALELVDSSDYQRYAQHVLLLTRGRADAYKPTITALDDFEALAKRFARASAPVSVIGLANELYTRTVPSAIAEIAGGNYAFATDSSDLLDAVAVEAQTAFSPIARDLHIELRAAPGYRIGQVFGARRVEVMDDHTEIDSPMLYLAARASAGDVAHGRRGGGGGIFVQLLADEQGKPAPADAFTLSLDYDDVASGRHERQQATLSTPLGVGRSPTPENVYFSNAPLAKPFMALNMYIALRAALRLYEAHGCGGSLGIRGMMQQSYDYWRATYDDPDIDADFQLLSDLIDNIDSRCDQLQYQVPFVELGCFLS